MPFPTTAVMTRRQRLGWLLRANRMCGAREEHHQLRDFAAAYAHCGPDTVSLSTLSRWETGVSDLSYTGVRRYERLLGLPPLSLVSVCDTTSRYLTPPGRCAPLLGRPPLGREKLDELIDRARGGDVMSGADWDDLSDLMARHPGMVISPAGAWTELAERLLTEMSIADGYFWMARAEALNRLMAHPVGQEAAIAVAAAAAADESVQSMIGTVTIFDASAHPAASACVVRHVTHPVTDRTFYGGLLASAKKLRFGHLDQHQVGLLVPVLLDLVGHGHRLNEASLAATLLRMLPADVTRRIGDRLWQRTVALLGQPGAAGSAVGRVTAETTAETTGAGGGFTDRLLPGLVSELLYDPVFDMRLYTCFLVNATPYRLPMARALARELGRAGRAGATDRSIALLEALRVLGDETQRRQVERLLLTPGVPPAVANSAAYALGHIGGRSCDEYWDRLTSTYLNRWRCTRSQVDASILDRVVYALGMSDRLDLLGRLGTETAVPTRVRQAVLWWTGLPDHIRLSART
jgi:hypothetical protein